MKQVTKNVAIDLPGQPLKQEQVQSLANADAFVGIRPIESRHNNLITELIVYKTETSMYALAFNPTTENWRLLDGYNKITEETEAREAEEHCMELLQVWRQQNTIPYLVNNGLIPRDAVATEQ